MDKETGADKTIKYISIVSFCLGLGYGVWLLYCNVVKSYEIKNTEVQILAVLLATGLLAAFYTSF